MRQAVELIYFVAKDGMIAHHSNEMTHVQNSRSPNYALSVLLCSEELEQSNSLYHAVKNFEVFSNFVMDISEFLISYIDMS